MPGLDRPWPESLRGNHPGQPVPRLFRWGHPWQIGESLVLAHLRRRKAHPSQAACSTVYSWHSP